MLLSPLEFIHAGWNSGSIWCYFSSFCFGSRVLYHKGLCSFIFFFFEVFLFFCQHSGLNFIFHNCSFELLEQLLLWEVCFKFSYLCSCVQLQPWYVRFFLLNFGVNCWVLMFFLPVNGLFWITNKIMRKKKKTSIYKEGCRESY